MQYSVKVPVAALLTLTVEADSPELAMAEAKQQITDDIQDSVSSSDEIDGTPFDKVAGADGDNDVAEGSLFVISAEEVE